MRISEMTQRVVRAEPVDIILWRTRYVPGNAEAGTLEHWTADRDADPETVGLLLDNAAFSLMADFFGDNDKLNEQLIGKPFAIMEPIVGEDGEPLFNEDGSPQLRQKHDEVGEPVVGFDPPPNRAKVVQEIIAIATHRDARAVGAAMMPDLLEEYYVSVLVAVQIGRGVDPTNAEATVRALLPLLGVDLGVDLNALARTMQEPETPSPSSAGARRSSKPEEPSASSGG